MKIQIMNPVGVAKLETVEPLVRTLADTWQQENQDLPKWWQFWKRKEFRAKAIKFLVDALDALIKRTDEFMTSGPDKKATVLAAISALYDVVLKDLLPLWFIPFAAAAKQLIVYVLISIAIDYIVKNYHAGTWKEGNAQEEPQKVQSIPG